MTWNRTTDIARSLNILGNLQKKLQCLIFEMPFAKEMKPLLNKQCDLIRAKLSLDCSLNLKSRLLNDTTSKPNGGFT